MYHGGTYGTYLEWCLTTLCSKDSIVSPFTAKSTSHLFLGNSCHDIEGWHDYCNLDQDLQFVRFHPKTKKDQNLVENLNTVISRVNKAIYIHPDTDSVIWSINNFYYKIWEDWWVYQFSCEIDQNEIYNNWPVHSNMPINEIPAWIRREFLSLYLVPAWQDQVEWNNLNLWSNPKCHVVLVKNLMHNFEKTIESIRNFCQLEFCRPLSELLPYHQQNINSQKFINQDTICHNIVHNMLSEQPHQWEPLPLPSEAWVQWQLRNYGYEMRCHGLDIMPTNSVQLRELLYPV